MRPEGTAGGRGSLAGPPRPRRRGAARGGRGPRRRAADRATQERHDPLSRPDVRPGRRGGLPRGDRRSVRASGPDDQRELKRRRADGLKDLVEDARGPNGVAADARRDSATEPEEGTGAEDAWIPSPRRSDAGDHASRRADRPGRALLTITMDHRWLSRALADHGRYGLLDSGARVHPGTLRRWACDAEIVPMVLGSRSEPLDVGRGQRTASDAIRRALNVRDGGCAFPGCSRRPRRCQAHHVDHWLDGGDTALDNMCLLCRFHHQLIHHGYWSVQIVDGRPWFTPPEFLDPERQPRPGGRPRVPF